MTNTQTPVRTNRWRGTPAASTGNAVYGLGLIGALVYFWIQADTAAEYLFAVVKGLLWPAFLVYEAFGHLA